MKTPKARKAVTPKARKAAAPVLLPVAECVTLTPAEAAARVAALPPALLAVALVVARAAAGTDDATLAVEAGLVDAATVAAARDRKAHHGLPGVRAWRKRLSRLARALGVAPGGSQRARTAETVREGLAYRA